MAAVAHHGDAVAMFENLRHTMRDINDGNAPFRQPVHDPEKRLRFGLGQSRRRLVEDQDTAIECQRLGDFDDLLLRNRQVSGPAGGIDITDFPQHNCRPLFEIAIVHEPGAALARLRHKHVLGDRNLRAERDFLMHETDAKPVRRIGRGYLDRFAIQHDFPAIRLQNAVDDMHQRRLAGAVFTGQRMDFAAPQLECRIAQRPHGAERLVNIRHAEDDLTHNALPNLLPLLAGEAQTSPDPERRVSAPSYSR